MLYLLVKVLNHQLQLLRIPMPLLIDGLQHCRMKHRRRCYLLRSHYFLSLQLLLRSSWSEHSCSSHQSLPHPCNSVSQHLHTRIGTTPLHKYDVVHCCLPFLKRSFYTLDNLSSCGFLHRSSNLTFYFYFCRTDNFPHRYHFFVPLCA